MNRMHFWRRAALLALAAALGPSLTHAVDPCLSRPIRMIVPFPPGGSTDILGRAIAAKLQESLGQPVVVENKPGAGGSIGATEAARSAGDGYTLLMGHIGTLAINPSLYPKLPYDPRKSFAPVALVARVPNVLVVNPHGAGEDVRRADRARQGEARAAALCVGRQRQRCAPCDGVLQAARGRRHHAHPIQGNGARGHRRARRAGRDDR